MKCCLTACGQTNSGYTDSGYTDIGLADSGQSDSGTKDAAKGTRLNRMTPVWHPQVTRTIYVPAVFCCDNLCIDSSKLLVGIDCVKTQLVTNGYNIMKQSLNAHNRLFQAVYSERILNI